MQVRQPEGHPLDLTSADNHTPAMWQCARSTLEPGTGYNKQKMRVVWLVSMKYKKGLVPSQGALTHDAHTVTPHSKTQQVSALLALRECLMHSSYLRTCDRRLLQLTLISSQNE